MVHVEEETKLKGRERKRKKILMKRERKVKSILRAFKITLLSFRKD